MSGYLRAASGVWLVALAPWLLGCSSPDEDETEEDCSVDGQKAYVHALMQDHYLWYDLIPDARSDDYASPEALLDALAYRELDRWTGMEPAEARATFFHEARFVGVGYQLVWDHSGAVRVAFSHDASPAGRADLERGTRILAINGTAVEEIEQEALWGSIEGPNEVGTVVQLSVEHSDGTERELELSKDWVEISSVQTKRVFDAAAGQVGYLLFGSFLATSADELRAAFEDFRSQGVTELILDLRYNAGGLVEVTQVLGSLIAGPELQGEVLIRRTYNDRHSDRNHEVLLTAEDAALSLSRLTAITGAGTASASEVLINGLRPLLPVDLIGERTHGKPVGADTWTYCEQAISPITFQALNADGEGDFFDGLGVDCETPDDLTALLGDPLEARLQAALAWIEDGSCEHEPTDASDDSAPGLQPQSLAPPDRPPVHGGRLITTSQRDTLGWR